MFDWNGDVDTEGDGGGGKLQGLHGTYMYTMRCRPLMIATRNSALDLLGHGDDGSQFLS